MISRAPSPAHHNLSGQYCLSSVRIHTKLAATSRTNHRASLVRAAQAAPRKTRGRNAIRNLQDRKDFARKLATLAEVRFRRPSAPPARPRPVQKRVGGLFHAQGVADVSDHPSPPPHRRHRPRPARRQPPADGPAARARARGPWQAGERRPTDRTTSDGADHPAIFQKRQRRDSGLSRPDVGVVRPFLPGR